MPFKDPEAKRAYLRAYYQATRDRQIERAREWAKAHPEAVRETNRKWYATRGKAHRDANRERIREQQRAYVAAHPERHAEKLRTGALRRKYGLTPAAYEAMLLQQDGVCACCRRPETHRNRNGEVSRLAVDHDHATGSVRALLCHSCNTGIGSFFDDPALLRLAADYIESFRVTG